MGSTVAVGTLFDLLAAIIVMKTPCDAAQLGRPSVEETNSSAGCMTVLGARWDACHACDAVIRNRQLYS